MRGEIKILGLLAIAVVIAVMTAMMPVAVADIANDTDDATVTITIATQTWVNVDPETLDFGTVNPGAASPMKQIQIENIGSMNITKIWFNVSQPSERPFATGNGSKYDPGNFIRVKPEGADESQYYFIDRVEFNESRSLVYLTDPDGNTPPSGYNYGRFRNGSYEYFWMVQPGDCAGKTFYIGNNPHTKTESGTINFQTGSKTTVTLTAGPTGWCYGDITSGPLAGYVIVVKNNTADVVRWYKYNKDAPAADSATNDVYFFEGTLYPGNSTVADLQMLVPYGVVLGQKTGTLTVLVNDQ